MNGLLVRTPDDDMIADLSDSFSEAVDHMVDEEDEDEEEAMEEMMLHGGSDDADIILNQSLEESPLTEAEINSLDDPVTWTINVFGEGCKSTKVIQCKCGKPLAEGQVCSACKMSNK